MFRKTTSAIEKELVLVLIVTMVKKVLLLYKFRLALIVTITNNSSGTTFIYRSGLPRSKQIKQNLSNVLTKLMTGRVKIVMWKKETLHGYTFEEYRK
jgi:hypothetical protein